MPAPLSIVIPTLNAAARLPGCAASLMEGLDCGLVRELVISDGGSTDATLEIAQQLGATIVSGAPGRGGQLQRGAEAARADWMLFLHADTQLSEGWSDPVSDHIRTNPRAGYFQLGFDAKGFRARFFEVGANLRSRLGLPYGDQGLLISRGLYRNIGGYEDIPIMEDVAIAKALRGQLRMLAARALTDAGRYQNGGWYRRGIRNMLTLLRYKLGVSPEKLAAYYEKQR